MFSTSTNTNTLSDRHFLVPNLQESTPFRLHNATLKERCFQGLYNNGTIYFSIIACEIRKTINRLRGNRIDTQICLPTANLCNIALGALVVPAGYTTMAGICNGRYEWTEYNEIG